MTKTRRGRARWRPLRRGGGCNEPVLDGGNVQQPREHEDADYGCEKEAADVDEDDHHQRAEHVCAHLVADLAVGGGVQRG